MGAAPSPLPVTSLHLSHHEGALWLVATWDKRSPHASEYLEQFTTSAKWGEDCLSPLGPLARPCGEPTEPLGTGAAQAPHRLKGLQVTQIHGGVWEAGKAERQPVPRVAHRICCQRD